MKHEEIDEPHRKEDCCEEEEGSKRRKAVDSVGDRARKRKISLRLRWR